MPDDPLSIEHTSSGVVVVLRGDLSRETAEGVWDRVITEAKGATGTLTINLAGVPSCDGFGVGLISEADQLGRAAGAEVRLEGASDDIAELLKMARIEVGSDQAARSDGGLVSQVGAATAELARTLGGLIGFCGTLVLSLGIAAATLNPARIREIVGKCTQVGADAVPVVSLLGGLIGFILAVQAAKALSNVGAISLVPMVVGFATLREFAPLISGIIVAGRSGSAFAAELGTMKVTEELDAYSTMGLDPMVILVAPRVFATTLVLPILAIYSMVLGVIGGSVPMFAEGFTFRAYLNGVIESVAVADLVQAIVKATVFGFILSGISCFEGLRTGRGADAVGASATRAVVSGIVAILVADSILSSIFYSLGY